MIALRRLAPLLFLLIPSSPSLQRGATPPAVSVPFVDVTRQSTIDFIHKSGASPDKYMVETFGSGVAWLDYDNDGFQDLFFINGAPGPRTRCTTTTTTVRSST